MKIKQGEIYFPGIIKVTAHLFKEVDLPLTVKANGEQIKKIHLEKPCYEKDVRKHLADYLFGNIDL